MAAYIFRGQSASGWVTGTGTLTPTLPSGWQPGDLHLFFTTTFQGSATLATPAGWTLLSLDSEVTVMKIFGRIAQVGDTDPSVDWSGTSSGEAIILGYFGDVYPSLGSIVLANTDRATVNSSSPLQISTRALTIAQNDCLVICYGKLLKTATSNGATFPTPPTGFTERVSNVRNGTADAEAIWDWQQTTATSLSASVAIYSASDTTPAAVYSTTVALKSQAASGSNRNQSGTLTGVGG